MSGTAPVAYELASRASVSLAMLSASSTTVGGSVSKGFVGNPPRSQRRALGARRVETYLASRSLNGPRFQPRSVLPEFLYRNILG